MSREEIREINRNQKPCEYVRVKIARNGNQQGVGASLACPWTVVLRPAASVSRGNLLEMHVLRPHPLPSSGTLGVGSASWALPQDTGESSRTTVEDEHPGGMEAAGKW